MSDAPISSKPISSQRLEAFQLGVRDNLTGQRCKVRKLNPAGLDWYFPEGFSPPEKFDERSKWAESYIAGWESVND